MPEQNEVTMLCAGRHLSMVQRGHWEYATRNTKKPAVGIVAITDAGKIILVEQYRPPVGCRVVELPAGLAGDIAGSEDEPLLEAAKRELLEETGARATKMERLTTIYPSPGFIDERIHLFLATGLTVGATSHEKDEFIEVASRPLPRANGWRSSCDSTSRKRRGTSSPLAEGLPRRKTRGSSIWSRSNSATA